MTGAPVDAVARRSTADCSPRSRTTRGAGAVAADSLPQHPGGLVERDLRGAAFVRDGVDRHQPIVAPDRGGQGRHERSNKSDVGTVERALPPRSRDQQDDRRARTFRPDRADVRDELALAVDRREAVAKHGGGAQRPASSSLLSLAFATSISYV
jgi:hypothetical protein